MSRAKFLAVVILMGSASLLSVSRTSEKPTSRIADVYKTTTCNCCSKWVSLLERDDSEVRIHNLTDLSPIKERYHVPAPLRSCHTAVVDGYVFEGHVPLDLMRRVLADRPNITGLAVPGMPIGSPGMEMSGRKDPYKVVAFLADGATYTYAER